MKAAFDSKGELPLRSTGEEACPFAAPELRGLGAARGQTPHRSPTPNLVKHLLRPIHQSHLPTPMTSEDLNHQDRCQDASRENTSNQSAPGPTWATGKCGFLGWGWVEIEGIINSGFIYFEIINCISLIYWQTWWDLNFFIVETLTGNSYSQLQINHLIMLAYIQELAEVVSGAIFSS